MKFNVPWGDNNLENRITPAPRGGSLRRGIYLTSAGLLTAFLIACSSDEYVPPTNTPVLDQRPPAASSPSVPSPVSEPPQKSDDNLSTIIESTPEVQGQTSNPPSVIIDKPTIDLLYHFIEPENAKDRVILAKEGVVKYHQYKRAEANFDLGVSLVNLGIDLIGHNLVMLPVDMVKVFINDSKRTISESYTLSFETFGAYQDSKGINQTHVQAVIQPFQLDATNKRTPIQDLDMGLQEFAELEIKYSNPFVVYAMDKDLSDEAIGRLSPFSDDQSLDDIDKLIIATLAKSHPEVQRILADKLAEEGLRQSDMMSTLRTFDQMADLPFIEGENILFFYEPTSFRRDVRYDTKEYMDEHSIVRVTELAYEIQRELTGFSPVGDHKLLVWYSSGRPDKITMQPLIFQAISDTYPINILSEENLPSLMLAYLDPNNFISPEFLNRGAMYDLLFGLTLEELLKHGDEFTPEAQDSLTGIYSVFADPWEMSLEYLSRDPDQKPGQTGSIAVIRQIAENYGEDFYKNFFHIWNNAESYVEANPGVTNGLDAYQFLQMDQDGNQVEDLEVVGNTLNIAAFSAASGQDLLPQFSNYNFDIHQGLYGKAFTFFSGVMNHINSSQR